MAAPSTRNETEWIQLTDKKHFSRLLYANPVCFLGTYDSRGQKNVMVISWLSASNNEGCFIMSLNKRRYSATILDDTKKFSLSIPVAGSEDLIRNVGRTTGAWGSKFPGDPAGEDIASSPVASESSSENIAGRSFGKRQRKLAKRFSSGVPGLEAYETSCTADTPAFGIVGTVAHLQCEAYQILDNAIDDQHYLILARVTAASVHPDYWDGKDCLFRPAQHAPPYLSFFGSGKFGYTSTTPSSPAAQHSV